jgi:hypothetical protein
MTRPRYIRSSGFPMTSTASCSKRIRRTSTDARRHRDPGEGALGGDVTRLAGRSRAAGAEGPRLMPPRAIPSEG